jgi:hypothetical protein
MLNTIPKMNKKAQVEWWVIGAIIVIAMGFILVPAVLNIAHSRASGFSDANQLNVPPIITEATIRPRMTFVILI